jgi:hypothetical protein
MSMAHRMFPDGDRNWLCSSANAVAGTANVAARPKPPETNTVVANPMIRVRFMVGSFVAVRHWWPVA